MALLIQLISCAFMTGLIWTIQVLHYPAFAEINSEKFAVFHHQHSNKITWIVGPLMLSELFTAIFLLYQKPSAFLLQINIGLLILIWCCTAFLSIPIHNQLSKGQNNHSIRKLVLTNWPRTVLWSVRLIILLTYTLEIFGKLNVDFS